MVNYNWKEFEAWLEEKPERRKGLPKESWDSNLEIFRLSSMPEVIQRLKNPQYIIPITLFMLEEHEQLLIKRKLQAQQEIILIEEALND